MYKQEISNTAIYSDTEIIARVLAGEKDWYAWLIKKYNARLYRTAMAIMDDDNEAEDSMQVTYIRAYENLPQFAGRSSFSTWLIRILVNECLQRKRKNKRIISGDENIVIAASTQLFSMQTASGTMINNELKEILETSIRNLPEKYRTVFVLREIEGLSIAETQECLDLSEANVKVRLNRAKVLLKEMLSAFYQKEDILHFHLTRCDKMVRSVMQAISA